MIYPILTDNSEVSGTFVRSDVKSWHKSRIEKAHFRFCKRYLEIQNKASNIVSRAELGKYPAGTKRRSHVPGRRSQVSGARSQVAGHRKFNKKVRYLTRLFMFICLFVLFQTWNEALRGEWNGKIGWSVQRATWQKRRVEQKFGPDAWTDNSNTYELL